MKSEYAGEEVLLHVDFLVEEQFVMPDTGTVRLSIRDSVGAYVPGFNKVAQPDPPTNSVDIVLPATVQTIPGQDDFAIRYCRVDFSYQGSPQSRQITYRVVPFVPMQVGPEVVRAKIGCTYEELPDADIDLYGAYLKYKDRVNFQTSLVSMKADESVTANNLLAVEAAIAVLPSLRVRLFKKEEKDNAANTRNTLDFDGLAADLLTERQKALDALDALYSVTSVQPRTVFAVSLPIDPVTNA